MAIIVPNTNTFSLQDVWNAVKDHAPGTTGDLSDCFANAISNYFDPAYNNDSYAPANSMKRFRNYGPKEYIKEYIIETLRFTDAPTPYANTINWPYLQFDTYYYLEMQLTNPDVSFIKNIWWHVYMSEMIVPDKIDYTWIEFEPMSYDTKYIVIDNDPIGYIKNYVYDTPSTFDSLGVRYDIGVASNYSSKFYIKFKAKPYANYTESKTMHIQQEMNSDGDFVSFIEPNRTFQVAYVFADRFKRYFPNPVSLSEHGGIVTLLGYSGMASTAKLVTIGGSVVASSILFTNKATKVVIPPSTVPGTYYLKLYDNYDNEVEEVGTIIVTS